MPHISAEFFIVLNLNYEINQKNSFLKKEKVNASTGRFQSGKKSTMKIYFGSWKYLCIY